MDKEKKKTLFARLILIGLILILIIFWKNILNNFWKYLFLVIVIRFLWLYIFRFLWLFILRIFKYIKNKSQSKLYSKLTVKKNDIL